MPMPDMSEEQLKVMEAFMKIVWLLPLAGIIEIIGGILFIIPKYRALGAIVILPVMVGIVLHNILMEPSGIEMALVLFAINLWIILDNWKKYQPLMS